MINDTGQAITIRPKASRTSAPKVRSGCVTCKKRHVKCDEAKPYCMNCLKTRGHCEGYVHVPRKNQARGQGQLTWDSNHGSRPACPVKQLHVDMETLDFRNAKEQRYFQEFVDMIRQPWLAAGSHQELWEITLPQLTRGNITLRRAAMAIGALSMWHRQSKHETLRAVSAPVRSSRPGDSHYFLALTYYSESMKLHLKHRSIQNAVFLSILLLTFETLRGNRKAALDHVNHGLALLLTLIADEESRPHVDSMSPDPRPPLGAIASVFSHLGPQARTILQGQLGQCTPLPHFTQGLKERHHTIETFAILASQLAPKMTLLDQIPIAFQSLDDAAEYVAAAQQRQYRLGGIMMAVVQDSGVLAMADKDAIDAFWAGLAQHPRITQFCAETRRLSRALTNAFQPMFIDTVLSDGNPDSVAKALHLRLQCLDLEIFEDPAQHVDLDLLEAQTPACKEYLSIVEMALRAWKRRAENPAYQLSLQSKVAWRLFIVAFFCRDPLVREDALWKLRDYPGYDGLWNSRALYALALRNRAVEKDNAVEGTPWEQWNRLWRREYVFEEGGDGIVFRYLEKDTSTGQWELVEEAAVIADSDDVQWKRQPLSLSGKLIMAELIA